MPQGGFERDAGGGSCYNDSRNIRIRPIGGRSMKPVTLALTTLLAAGAAALVVSPSSTLAQYPGGAGATGPNPQLIEAKKQIQLAEKDVVRIRQDMQKIKARISSRYEGKDDWE